MAVPIRPHDRLFRLVFGDPECAAELLRRALPRQVVAAIDWRTLRRVPGTFLDAALREHVTDLLFTAEMNGRPVLLYVLFEHKSGDDPAAPFQVLRYQVRILEQHVRENGLSGGLPPILPIVFCNGPRPWRSPTRLRRLFRIDGIDRSAAAWLLRLQPDSAFVVHDLGSGDVEDEERALSIVTWISIQVLRRARGLDLEGAEQLLVGWRTALPRLLQHARGAEVLGAVYSYLLSTVDCEPPQLHAIVQSIFPPQTSEIMTSAADRLHAAGLSQGLSQGLSRGRLETLQTVLQRQLHTRFGTLSASQQERLQAASVERLEAMALRVLTARTVDEVLGG